MWKVFQSLITRRQRREAARRDAWQAAYDAWASAEQAFEGLDVSVSIAIQAKNQAMRLVQPEAPAIEATWSLQEKAVREARQKYACLTQIAAQYTPQVGPPTEEYRNLRVSYDNMVRLARDVDEQLQDFTVWCESISFSPAGLHAWVDQLLDSDVRLERLHRNMVADRSGVPPHADVDELHGLMREAEVLLRSEDYDELADHLAIAEQVAQDLEEQFEVHLGFGDYKQLLFVDASRRVAWTERHIASVQDVLTALVRDYGLRRVEDVVQAFEDAPVGLAKARTQLAKAASTMAGDPSRNSTDVAFELQSAIKHCWEVDQVCNAVARRERELKRERDKHARDHVEFGPIPEPESGNDEG